MQELPNIVPDPESLNIHLPILGNYEYILGTEEKFLGICRGVLGTGYKISMHL